MRPYLVLLFMVVTSFVLGMLYVQFLNSLRKRKFLKFYLNLVGFFAISGSGFALMNNPDQSLSAFDFIKSTLFYGSIVTIQPVAFFILFSFVLHPLLKCGLYMGKNKMAYFLLSAVTFLLPLLFVRGSIMSNPPTFFILFFGICACIPALLVIVFHEKSLKKQLIKKFA